MGRRDVRGQGGYRDGGGGHEGEKNRGERSKVTPVDPQDICSLSDRVLAWLLLPPTMWGMAGAIFSQTRGPKRSIPQRLCNIAGGVVTVHLTAPIAGAYVPTQWMDICCFLLGFGGLEFVDWLYGAAKAAIEARLLHMRGRDEGKM